MRERPNSNSSAKPQRSLRGVIELRESLKHSPSSQSRATRPPERPTSFRKADLRYWGSTIWIGLGLAVVGYLLGRYTINPSFPDGAYAGMTRRSWRTLGGVIITLGAVMAIYGLISLI